MSTLRSSRSSKRLACTGCQVVGGDVGGRRAQGCLTKKGAPANWLNVMGEAQSLGLTTSATNVIGFGEDNSAG